MTFYKLEDKDIIHTTIAANPAYVVSLNGDVITGSVYLENQYIDAALANRMATGFSERKGGQTSIFYPLTASVSIRTAVSGGTGDSTWKAINNLYNYYSLYNANYNVLYNGSTATAFSVINIPEIYYDKGILSGTFSASDMDANGDYRNIYDDGMGSVFSASVPPENVGNIFYNEGLVVLKKTDLFTFGTVSSENFKWSTSFEGIHRIPVVMWRLTAPAGQLNSTTNPTYYYTPTTGYYKNMKVALSAGLEPYITNVGLYNSQYELIATVKLAQPVKKYWDKQITIKAVFDW